jgi:spore coat protein CotH
MEANKIIEKLRATFNEMTGISEPVKQNFMDVTLMDGTAIQVTEMVVGGIVTINGAPAPAGEYELADGSYIVVGDGGAITELKPAEVAPVEGAPVSADAEIGSKFAAFESATNEKFAAYEVKFSAYEQKFADYETKLAKANQVIEGLLNLTQTLAETPTGKADEVVKATNAFKEESKFNYSILFK